MSKSNEIKDTTSLSGVPISLIFAVILAIVVAIFALQNSSYVLLKAFLWEVEVPLSLLLFSTLAIGVVLTVLFSIPGWNSKRKVQKYQKKQIEELKELLKVEKENPATPKTISPPTSTDSAS